MEVLTEYKGVVMGKRGETLKKISTLTGAEVIRKRGDVYIVSGTEDQRQRAKAHIKIIIVSRSIQSLFPLKAFEQDKIKD